MFVSVGAQLCTQIIKEKKMRTGKTNIQTISKGYRLKPATHNMIRRMQIKLDSTQDKVISSALKLYYLHLKKQLLINTKSEN
jgi:hypothetical protein